MAIKKRTHTNKRSKGEYCKEKTLTLICSDKSKEKKNGCCQIFGFCFRSREKMRSQLVSGKKNEKKIFFFFAL